jgi:hypothetical protein
MNEYYYIPNLILLVGNPSRIFRCCVSFGKVDMEAGPMLNNFVRQRNADPESCNLFLVLSRHQNGDGVNSLNVLELVRTGALGTGDLYQGMPEVGIVEGRAPYDVARDDVVDTMALVFKKVYMDKGLALYFQGMENVFFITDVGDHADSFTMRIFEEVPDAPVPDGQCLMVRLNTAEMVYLNKCEVRKKIRSVMAYSTGASSVFVETYVSPEFWGEIVKLYPEGDGQPTRHRKFVSRHGVTCLEDDGHTTVAGFSMEHGIEILTFRPLGVLSKFLGDNFNWVGTIYLYYSVIDRLFYVVTDKSYSLIPLPPPPPPTPNSVMPNLLVPNEKNSSRKFAGGPGSGNCLNARAASSRHSFGIVVYPLSFPF